MIELEECRELGCEKDIATLKARYEIVEYFEREGESFPQMVREILDALNGREIGAYVALCHLRPDTSLIEVSEALGMLGEDGVFVTVEGEKEALKYVAGMGS